ncbi:MAG: hypothetical protein BECKG1743D_GA0114223_100542 [Candidatus Kentron sp. G]|nr:MAG: hypothetical protein BECKG1743D_GA0114223_100542 [Candidatus Kentron sp. G]VFN02091.1 MAG: hypothetical protein BECKG1743F_GA0114225_106481 [Candidatus Kentron sp. G]VFN03832.1 MAG: hypothetical protein BECKG1743E_GA0114224_106603 [Candidatus Kentron sp. G]
MIPCFFCWVTALTRLTQPTATAREAEQCFVCSRLRNSDKLFSVECLNPRQRALDTAATRHHGSPASLDPSGFHQNPSGPRQGLIEFCQNPLGPRQTRPGFTKTRSGRYKARPGFAKTRSGRGQPARVKTKPARADTGPGRVAPKPDRAEANPLGSRQNPFGPIQGPAGLRQNQIGPRPTRSGRDKTRSGRYKARPGFAKTRSGRGQPARVETKPVRADTRPGRVMPKPARADTRPRRIARSFCPDSRRNNRRIVNYIARKTATELSRAWKCIDAHWERRSEAAAYDGTTKTQRHEEDTPD